MIARPISPATRASRASFTIRSERGSATCGTVSGVGGISGATGAGGTGGRETTDGSRGRRGWRRHPHDHLFQHFLFNHPHLAGIFQPRRQRHPGHQQLEKRHQAQTPTRHGKHRHLRASRIPWVFRNHGGTMSSRIPRVNPGGGRALARGNSAASRRHCRGVFSRLYPHRP